MKKLLIIILILLPLTSFAQRFKGGIELGFNTSQIQGDSWTGFYKAGLVGGAFVNTDLLDNWGAQMEIRYAAKGSAPGINHPSNRKIRLEYIELPLLITYDFADQFQAQGGISLGYLYSSTFDDGYGWEDFDRYDKYELAAALGVDYALFDRLSLNIRISTSIIPIYASYPGSVDPSTSYNHVITFAGYYQIGK